MFPISQKAKYVLLAAAFPYLLAAPQFSISADAQPRSNMAARSAVIGHAANSLDSANSYGHEKTNTEHYYQRGVELFEAKEYDKAYSMLRRVLRVKPYDANTNFYMARVQSMRGNHKKAVSNYQKTLRQYKDSPILLAGLGSSYAKINQREKANAILDRLETASLSCNNVCEDAPVIATSLHVVAISLYPASTQ